MRHGKASDYEHPFADRINRERGARSLDQPCQRSADSSHAARRQARLNAEAERLNLPAERVAS